MEYVAKQGTTALGIIGTALGGLAVAGGSLLAANGGRAANGVGQLTLFVVAIGNSVGVVEGCSRPEHVDATPCSIINIIVLRDCVGWRRVADLEQLPVGIILPRCSEPIGIRERRFEVATIKIGPGELFDCLIVWLV